MEVSELRIGNYYWSGYNCKISKLTGFIPEGSGYEIEGVYFNGYLIEGCDKLIPWGSLDPIPLTDEWFLKFGFKIRDTGSCKIYFNEEVEFETRNGLLWHLLTDEGLFSYTSIHSVHQLQNLFFALKGKELYLTPLN